MYGEYSVDCGRSVENIAGFVHFFFELLFKVKLIKIFNFCFNSCLSVNAR